MTESRRPELVLASGSGIRRQLMEAAGARFLVDPADIDEEALIESDPGTRASRLALAKAERVSARQPGLLVLGSDQVIEVDGCLPPKPMDKAAVLEQLRTLAGRTHTFYCGVALVLNGRPRFSFVDRAHVRFRPVDDRELIEYAASGEGIGCAGAYRLESGGVRFIESIEGSHFTVLGLPMIRLVDETRRSGDFDAIFR